MAGVGGIELDNNTMLLKLKTDTIKNEDFYKCLNSNDLNIILQTIYKIIDRKYCDKLIIEIFTKMAKLLTGYKIAGAYQIGHLAISALYLIQDESSLKSYEGLYSKLNDNDQFLVDSFIKGMKEKD